MASVSKSDVFFTFMWTEEMNWGKIIVFTLALVFTVRFIEMKKIAS